MKILIDLQSCQSGSRFGGIGRYSMALAKAMMRVGHCHDFYVLLNKSLPSENEVRAEFIDLIPQHKILAIDIPSDVAENKTAATGQIGLTRMAELIREKFIADLSPDIVHVTSLIEGLGDDVVTSVGLLFPASRTAVTLYDLIPLVEREKYLTNHVLEKHFFKKIDHMRNAGILLAISNYSKIEGHDVGEFASDRIVNISSAVDSKFKPRLISIEREQDLRDRFSIRQKFLIYVASFDSRKNQEGLIRAFALTSPDIVNNYQLVIVGKGWDEIYRRLKKIGKDSGLRDDAVLFLGHIADEDLIDLYNLSSLFVFPSFREGFGLPVLEAMSCGVPAIGSNTTSIPEVLGRSDAMFDPQDTSAISAKLEKALLDQSFYESLKKHSLAHSKNFSWEMSAKRAIEFMETTERLIDDKESALGGGIIYRKFLSRVAECPDIKNVPDNFLLRSSSAVADNEISALLALGKLKREVKIGWVTTWNTKCGIASYSKNLVGAINQPSVIFAPFEQALIDNDGENIIRCWRNGGGNLSMLNASVDRADVDVLSIQLNFGFHDFSVLSDFIVRQKTKGRVVTVTLHSTVDPPPEVINRRLSELAPALGVCDAVLIHSLNDVVNLNRLGIHKNLVFFPQGVIKASASERKTEGGIFKVASYGFALPHKGLEQLIIAVDMLSRQGVEIRLDMVNAIYSDSASEALINRCKKIISDRGLSSRIRMITDYLENEDSLSLLSSADLVVFPYQNTSESSSAAVRMGLASGVLVAVTPLSIFEDVRNFVYELPGTNSEDLALGIGKIIHAVGQDVEEIAKIREQSQRWRLCNDFEQLGRYFSDLVVGFVEKVAR
ncbi:glycosyltransferase [Acidovorax sp. sif1233]|uniref:glycosyltransferase n=1 Tax=Acidovorax sp. sif1233 TaxID=2854792 RepID=UPI001C471F80|nr:glycosyltransferase [Acidovorax sp. sif1233]MBV7453202.1 glycosyltransferase [Acidovorax sp. sif1233]